MYAGEDCHCKWARYLGDPDRPNALEQRLQEALGVTEDELTDARQRMESGAWHLYHVAELLDEFLACSDPNCSIAATVRLSVQDGPDTLGEQNPVRVHLGERWRSRPRNRGPPGHAAMPAQPRDRSAWFKSPVPTLQFACRMCEAEFPNRRAFQEHQDKTHGGQRWYQTQYEAQCELAPYVPSPTETRQARAARNCA